MTRVTRRLGLGLLIVAAVATAWLVGRSATTPQVFGLYAVWIDGSNDAHRAEIDRFLECLIGGSTLNHYWRGEARVERRGSFVLSPPGARLERDEIGPALVLPQIGAALPAPPDGETPLYLLFGGQPDLYLNACGTNGTLDIGGRVAGLGVVRNSRACWPTGDLLRSETQIAVHEIVETVDRVLGYGTCAGGGACRGRAICADRCATFVGLQCPGAPTGTYTGCDGAQVDGWVIQRLGYSGRDPAACDACAPCDFTPRVCPSDEPRCGLALPAVVEGGGCAVAL